MNKTTAIETLASAMAYIKSQTGSSSYQWHKVQNKTGAIFELGGSNSQGKLELKIYIPRYDQNGDIEYLNNGMANTGPSIGFNSWVHFHDGLNISDYNEFLRIIHSQDFRKIRYDVMANSMNFDWTGMDDSDIKLYDDLEIF